MTTGEAVAVGVAAVVLVGGGVAAVVLTRGSGANSGVAAVPARNAMAAAGYQAPVNAQAPAQSGGGVDFGSLLANVNGIAGAGASLFHDLSSAF